MMKTAMPAGISCQVQFGECLLAAQIAFEDQNMLTGQIAVVQSKIPAIARFEHEFRP